MIVAKFTMDESKHMVSLHMKGHAGSGTPGNDIVCASASILAYTLAQNIKGYDNIQALKYTPVIRLNKGNAIITARVNDDAWEEVVHTYIVIQTGFVLLTHNYPAFVAVEQFGEDTAKDI